MSFLLTILEYKWPIIFYALVFYLVYANRKKFDVHGNFVFLYRTKFGLKLMNSLARNAKAPVKFLGYLGVFIGFAGMILTFILVLVLTYNLLIGDGSSGGASPVIPGLPIAGTGLVFPLVTGWIVLFIIILVHEFSHGVVSSAHGVPVKNSGIAFFGPILGAFVEPDEKILSKKNHKIQHSVFAAGAMANFLTVLLVFGIIWVAINPTYDALTKSSGVIVFSQPGLAADSGGIKNGTVINGVDGRDISTLEDFRTEMEKLKPGQRINIQSIEGSYNIVTTENPDNPSQAYLGVWIMGEKRELVNDTGINRILLAIVEWISSMFGWLAFLSLNIGLINLLPIFITDGSRMLKIFLERVIKDKKRSLSVWLFFNWTSAFSLIIMVFLPLFRWLGASLLALIL
jgi:membrane-associated protease RseP (regulator of RpoE activity)